MSRSRSMVVGGSVTNTLEDIWPAVTVAGGALGAYHGFKRHDSVGWAVVWAVLGAAFPPVTIPIAVAQGFGKRA